MSELNVQVEEVSPVVRRVRVDVPPERVASVTEQVYQRLGRTVKLRGYRQGRVPRRVLERHFADQVRADVAREVVQSTFDEALGGTNIAPVAQPAVEPGELRPGEAFQYTARVEVRPEVVLARYKGLEASYDETRVEDAAVDAQVEQMRDGLSTLEPIEGREVAELNDTAEISYEVEFEGTGRAPQKRDHALVRVEAGQFIDGHGEALVGQKVGEVREFTETFPDDEETTEELRGKTARIAVTLKALKTRVVPAIDDELAKELGKDDLASLKAETRERLQKEADEENKRNRRESVMRALLADNPLEVPPSMVDNAAERMAIEVVRGFISRGLPVRDPMALVQQFKGEGQERALFEVQGFFLLDAVAKAEGIEVGPEDLTRRIEELAADNGVPVERVQAEFQTPDSLAGLASQIRRDRAYDIVEAAAVLTANEKKVDDEAGETASS